MARLNFPVGLQRIGPHVRPSQAGYTRTIRAQMRQVIDNMKRVVSEIEDVSPEALHYALQPIYDESQILVPVDTGALKASGFIETRSSTHKYQGVVGYARGGSPHYAVFVHERLDLRHNAPTQAKFLEEAVNRHLNEIIPRYAEYIKSDVGL